jgi:hypothetical protein
MFDLILPKIEVIGDRTGGVTMQTPKGLAKALVARAFEQWQLRRRQDEISRALAVAVSRDSGWSKLSTINASVFRRLSEIDNEKRAEATRIEGRRRGGGNSVRDSRHWFGRSASGRMFRRR